MKVAALIATAALLVVLALMMLSNSRRRTELGQCKAELDMWQGQLNTVTEAVKAQKADDDEVWEARLKHVEYVLWEVHEIPDVPDTELEKLCRTVSVHSNFWPGTELMGFGSFNDKNGKRMLTCRWISDRRDSP